MKAAFSSLVHGPVPPTRHVTASCPRAPMVLHVAGSMSEEHVLDYPEQKVREPCTRNSVKDVHVSLVVLTLQGRSCLASGGLFTAARHRSLDVSAHSLSSALSGRRTHLADSCPHGVQHWAFTNSERDVPCRWTKTRSDRYVRLERTKSSSSLGFSGPHQSRCRRAPRKAETLSEIEEHVKQRGVKAALTS